MHARAGLYADHARTIRPGARLSSFRGLDEVISRHRLFCSFYTDRGSHYFTTPKAGGKVDKQQLTQVGRALGGERGLNHADRLFFG